MNNNTYIFGFTVNASRRIKKVFKSKPTVEGAGVQLKRAFGFSEVPQLDPFLLLDDIRSGNPSHYRKGFPWHPHRGIETITYVLEGKVEHGDSLGNSGIIDSGDVQWMTAGSGIIHQEMPQGNEKGRMDGFQLWANLPAAEKMTPPRYRDVKSDDIPIITLENGIEVKIICGAVNNIRGPVHDIKIDPEYLDITVPAHTSHQFPCKAGHTVIVYVIGGGGTFARKRNLLSMKQKAKTILIWKQTRLQPMAPLFSLKMVITSILKQRQCRSVFCLFQESPWASRLPGTGRSL